ncbi:tol-pal system-associated acyl-CoA thioesterase [Pyruvatibacter mobilis]|uniref:Tol-pal system-associated acyl-CoA thioesterase n=2 Tax=Pyruvatibacter mobilis TaxID=1712261 RepID=A0A845QEH8_9HYPH|nr:tol-pal system-associated acyl-CoA thioesterase [Pyruvatibacter mobilis]QJD76721.1 tol-pal system-associated acyl-CoA thioesterase [Pyruvatibacter mobilis]
MPVRVYYEDTDASGIVYHANYLRFIERARTDVLRCAGLDHRRMMDAEDSTAFAVRQMDIRFHAPARLDDALEVRTRFTELRGARIRAAQSVWRGETLLFEAQVEVAVLDGAGRARRIPAFVRDALAAYVG